MIMEKKILTRVVVEAVVTEAGVQVVGEAYTHILNSQA